MRLFRKQNATALCRSSVLNPLSMTTVPPPPPKKNKKIISQFYSEHKMSNFSEIHQSIKLCATTVKVEEMNSNFPPLLD